MDTPELTEEAEPDGRLGRRRDFVVRRALVGSALWTSPALKAAGSGVRTVSAAGIRVGDAGGASSKGEWWGRGGECWGGCMGFPSRDIATNAGRRHAATAGGSTCRSRRTDGDRGPARAAVSGVLGAVCPGAPSPSASFCPADSGPRKASTAATSVFGAASPPAVAASPSAAARARTCDVVLGQRSVGSRAHDRANQESKVRGRCRACVEAGCMGANRI